MGSGPKRQADSGKLGNREEGAKTSRRRKEKMVYATTGEARLAEGPEKRRPGLKDRQGTRIYGR